MAAILRLDNVYKAYGNRDVIKGISFEVNEGEIYGFLGANGAGKTTTIRMITGLIKPDKGKIYINGFDIQKQFVNAISTVGCIVENADMYGEFTGRENLKIFAKLYGNVDKKRIDEVIEMIGLNDRIDDKVKKYSLGMKQRLGLGQALLPKPKLLILDEPTNGLDPIGIVDFRKIIRELVTKYKTAIFISSHILSEIEQLCGRVAFIDKGEIISIEDSGNLQYKNMETIALKVKECEKSLEILKNINFVKNIDIKDEIIIINIEKNCFSMLVNALTCRGINILDISRVQQNLENRFMEIAGGGK